MEAAVGEARWLSSRAGGPAAPKRLAEAEWRAAYVLWRGLEARTLGCAAEAPARTGGQTSGLRGQGRSGRLASGAGTGAYK